MKGVAVLLVILAALALVPGGGGRPATKRQRIAIEETPRQTFELIPLSPGPLEVDSGTVDFSGGFQSTGFRKGQFYRRYGGVEVFKGKRGVLHVPNAIVATDAGGGYQAGFGTWSVRSGTGSYMGLRGGGRETSVGAPSQRGSTRYEGWVTLP